MFSSKKCYHLFLVVFLSFVNFTFEIGTVDIKPVDCPGLYCGRTWEGGGNYTACEACPRGYRVNEKSICQLCEEVPTFYDWLYLGFMAMLAPALHWFFIDFTNKRKNGDLVILHLSALVESVIAAVCTLLVVEPYGSLKLRSCHVKALSDWYTMLYNPSPDYTSTLHCTQEAVYPLYTIVMIYYAFGLLCMLLFRPLLSAKAAHGKGSKSLYAALYFFPILVLVQAALGGLLYYGFAYIVLVISLVTNAIHFAMFQEQRVLHILKQHIMDIRMLMILLLHWGMHAYAIIGITQLHQPTFHGALLCLIPFPAIFYLMTVKFTDPEKLDVA